MPFEIIRNNIAEVSADAIVNTANPKPLIGAGTDAAIHEKAGPALLEARKIIGDIPVGQCAVTPAFGLDAKYVFHTVGPVWRGGMFREEMLLERCFTGALETAMKLGCESVAFPLISTGTYGFPRETALEIALGVFEQFLLEHDIRIILVVWDRESFLLSSRRLRRVQSFIDQTYIEEAKEKQKDFLSRKGSSVDRRRNRLGSVPEYPSLHPHAIVGQKSIETPTAEDEDKNFPCVESASKAAADSHSYEEPFSCAECATEAVADGLSYEEPFSCTKCATEAVADGLSLDEMLANTDAGFTETLLKLIDQTGKKDAEIYKKANVSKQHFSKIRNNPDYKPTKATAVAFAIALRLNLPQTQDLIGRAGYTLTRSSKFDVIIMYFINNRNYDMFEINMTLFQFDQMTLGV
ncbi:MAG: macro domain-containing protein [Oscillospiraceae bacterium]|nr:macro domain-containing protein [Oscillospiraceae bacterium]